MASQSIRVVLLSTALAVALSACQQNDEPQAVSNGQPTQIASEPAQIQVGPTRDSSLPDASAVFAAQDAADKAREDAVALQQSGGLQPEPAKSEESKGVQAAPAQAPDRLSVAPENTKVN